LRWPEQKRVFGLIPGLEHAEWVRYGQMHRNTYLNSPRLLEPTLQWREQTRGGASLYFAGQITGTEGYVGSTASGLVAGINAARAVLGKPPVTWPPTTMLGALLQYISRSGEQPFQPMKANFGILPPMDPPVRNKRDRYTAFAERALHDLQAFLAEESVLEDVH